MQEFRKINDELASYLRDESRNTGHAETISFPKTEDDIAEALARCYEDGTFVTVQGARTGLCAAACPDGGHILNVSKMTAVRGLRKDGDDYVAKVEPGLTLTEFRKQIAGRSFNTAGWSEEDKACFTLFARDRLYCFPPDPTESSAALGGMAACNASGSRSYRYGDTRRYIEGLRLVLADGRRLSIKRGECFAKGRKGALTCEDGSVVEFELPDYKMPQTSKNTAGYFVKDDMDLIDLIIGSDGTLGVISELDLRLIPEDPIVWGVSCQFEERGKAIAFSNKLREKLSDIAAIEYFDANALRLMRKQKAEKQSFAGLPDIPENVNYLIFTELHCETTEEALKSLFTIGDAMEELGVSEENSWVARETSELDRLIFLRHAIPESVNMLIDERKKLDPAITKLSTDFSVDADHIEELFSMFEEGLAAEGFESACWGHLGNYHPHMNIIPRNGEEYKRAKKLIASWAEKAAKMGGTVSSEHGVGKIKRDFLKYMYTDEQIGQMRALKLRFDPKNMLGRGNLFEA